MVSNRRPLNKGNKLEASYPFSTLYSSLSKAYSMNSRSERDK